MKVQMMEGAIADMKDIRYYIANDNSSDVADAVTLKIKTLIKSLENLPNSGNCVKELADIGYQQYRELHHKPYRIIYSIDESVFVHAVLDGRRDMQAALINRLIKYP